MASVALLLQRLGDTEIPEAMVAMVAAAKLNDGCVQILTAVCTTPGLASPRKMCTVCVFTPTGELKLGALVICSW